MSLRTGEGSVAVEGTGTPAVGRLVRTITAADLDTSTSFDVPTTVARFGRHLYLPTARFGASSPTTEEYWVTQVRAKP